MDYIREFLKNNGCTEEFQDKRWILLDDASSSWVVEEGLINVFAVELKDGEKPGRRHFIAQFEQGDFLFGTAPTMVDNSKFVFLCTGMTDSRMIKADKYKLQNFLLETREGDASLTSHGINRWYSLLESAIIDSGANNEYKQYTYMNWVQKLHSLNQFNQEILKKIANSIKDTYHRDQMLMEGKQKDDELFVQASLNKLINITNKSGKKHKTAIDRVELSKDPLAAACQLVGAATGVTIKLPPNHIMKNTDHLLYTILKNSRIQFRSVILTDEWWKSDNGPFLGFLTEDKAPIALIPISNKSYKMINPTDSTEKVIDKDLAEKIHFKAIMLYRTLPNKVLKLPDILKFISFGSNGKDLVLVLLVALLGGILNLFLPIANGVLFNNIIPSGEAGQLIQMAILMFSFSISGVLFQLVRSFIVLRIENKSESALQAAIWDRVISLPVPFFRQFSSGELAVRSMGFSYIRKEITGAVIITLLSSVFTFVNFFLMFRYDAKIAVDALLLIMIMAAFTLFYGRLQLRYRNEVTRLSNKISGQVLQIIGGISRLRIAGAEKRAFYQWAKAFGKQKEAEYKNKLVENIITTFNSVFPILASMLLFSVAYYRSDIGSGSFIAFYSAFLSIMMAMISLSSISISVNNVKSIYDSTKPILQSLPEYDEIKEEPGELDGSIELSHVTFRYHPDRPAVINDLSLKIEKGEYVAIVGPSGCGKSTLIRLLLGFEKPESGTIYYSGHDINMVDIRSIRKQLGVVMQNSQLMAGDIRSNVLGTNPNLTMEDAIRALKMAGIYDDIEAMPMGMFTAVSEGGTTLSGGQRQRLMIARVLVNKPKIILFDEATSALDNRTQAIVSKSMDSLKATRIVIAHRLSTIINCDRIIVIDKGRIVEEGSYEELMNNRNAFYQLAKRQLA